MWFFCSTFVGKSSSTRLSSHGTIPARPTADLPRHPLRRFLVFSLLLSIAGTSIDAQSISGRATGLSGNHTTFDFNGLPIIGGAAITTQLQSQGVKFGNAFYGPAITPGYGIFATDALYNYDPFLSSLSPLTIQFSAPVTAAAFNVATIAGTTTFDVFLGASKVYTFDGATDETASARALWWGVEGISFDRIQLTLNSPLNMTAMAIDNLQVATTVPEPSGVAMMSAGLLLIGLCSRRLRRNR